MKSMSTLSRGEFSESNIAEMERIILQALNWHLYPPTSFHFIYHFHMLLPTIHGSGKRTIVQHSHFFAELTAMDYTFVTLNSSVIAFSAILNAMEGLDVSLISEEDKCSYINLIENILGVNSMSNIIILTRNKIWDLFVQSAEFECHDIVINEEQKNPNQESNKLDMCKNNWHEMSPVTVMDP